ncbi:hypothetical protein BU24DRAFT_377110 [Aaosphaeria arxii CBS 175.79]|uniref:Anaphase-promoting complex subunit 2 n=1 Tax=Aaosphaeria arxii CBS 175.79 TaxID=1450172 RepID=A0A6A5XFK9_9PLEO|nr:uncharacterized protein BU24DRAFT_377110 [Aaosphaeria arxii CBS 175.79]KAF2011720.1 hypothetical protein BU24DRAFT_377110 [Aaosphaeria arxii CBS 175.79]
MDHRTLIFATVFPVPSISHSTPTPISTPDLRYTTPGEAFGGPSSQNLDGQHRTVKRNLAWSTATRFLSLPKQLHGLNTSLGSGTSFDIQNRHRGAEVEDALHYLLIGDGRSEEAQEETLVEWYTNEARLHFANVVRPTVNNFWDKEVETEQAWSVLERTQQIFQQAQALYLEPFQDHIMPFLEHSFPPTPRPTKPTQTIQPNQAEHAIWRFRQEVNAIFVHCLPPKRYIKTLSYALYEAGCRMFRIYLRQDEMQEDLTMNPARTRERLVSLLRGLERVGLGGEPAQQAFAHAMDKIMNSFISSHYLKVDWFDKQPVVPQLRLFIRDGFYPHVKLVMECLNCDSTVQPTELQSWQDMALSRLGRARVDTMFDFVINWDHSLGAILDIKEYLKVPGAKQHLTSSFSQQVLRRLLHAGATTTYILNVYIRIIRAFYELEPKGVLLERVARPIRRYLKERDDTAKIIILSLLADLNAEGGRKFSSNSELSYEIACEMERPSGNIFGQEADEELNYNDMNWQPLPSDASPDYKKSKAEDVVWFLLTLWEREDFINELKNLLGDHLLKCQDPHFEREIRLLELIKVRLGDEKLQACEVMLRDVLESKRINAAIHSSTGKPSTKDNGGAPETPANAGPLPSTPRPRRLAAATPSSQLLKTPVSAKVAEDPQLNAQIISSFFWPLLRDDHFLVPLEIQTLQKEYETRFERVKGMRKLRWMNALGDGTVTLELEDRTEEFSGLMPWQVSVIYAFQPQPGEEWAGGGGGKGGGRGKGHQKKSSKTPAPAITRNVEQLEEMLEMDEALVRQSLSFWVGKAVLRESHPDTFTVIENQSATKVDENAAAAAQELAEVQASAQAGAVRSQADLLAENKDVYCNFIMGMLTNQGNMPGQSIGMMLRMIGNFTISGEELDWLLQGLEKEERIVAMGGGVWGVKK